MFLPRTLGFSSTGKLRSNDSDLKWIQRISTGLSRVSERSPVRRHVQQDRSTAPAFHLLGAPLKLFRLHEAFLR